MEKTVSTTKSRIDYTFAIILIIVIFGDIGLSFCDFTNDYNNPKVPEGLILNYNTTQPQNEIQASVETKTENDSNVSCN